MDLLISEVLEKVSKVKTKQEKVDILRENDHQSLRMVIKSSFDPNIEWALPEGERIAPWQWRRGKRSIENESKLSFQCESKTTCRQMQNCAEARYYLINCGLTRLDGDKDGVPCESICR